MTTGDSDTTTTEVITEEASMPTYVSFINYTHKGVETIKDGGKPPPREGNGKRPRRAIRSTTLQVAEAACDYIHLYRGDREALTSSLDHIQHAASQILRAIEAGG